MKYLVALAAATLLLFLNLDHATAAPVIDSVYADSLFSIGDIVQPKNALGKRDGNYAILGRGHELDLYFTHNKQQGDLYPILPKAVVTVYGHKTDADTSAGEAQFFALFPNGVINYTSRAYTLGEGANVIQLPDSAYTYVAITLTGNGTNQGALSFSIDAVKLEEDLFVAGVRSPFVAPAVAMNVYPNPMQLSGKSATVGFRLDKARNVQLEVVDLLGHVVEKRELGLVQPGAVAVPVSLRAPGTYFTRLILDGAANTVSQKIIVTH